MTVQAVAFDLVADEADWKITKAQTVRIEPVMWKRLGAAAKVHGHTRSSLIRQIVRWYLSVPGAQLPARPEPGTYELTDPDDD